MTLFVMLAFASVLRASRNAPADLVWSTPGALPDPRGSGARAPTSSAAESPEPAD